MNVRKRLMVVGMSIGMRQSFLFRVQGYKKWWNWLGLMGKFSDLVSVLGGGGGVPP